MKQDRSKLPPSALEDPMGPPPNPTEVNCLHCGKVYNSEEIVWKNEKESGVPNGGWCCPMPGCNGAGFGFDIHPTNPDYIDLREVGQDLDD